MPNETMTKYVGAMTQREHYAGLAMQGILASKELNTQVAKAATNNNISFEEAVAMLAVGQAERLIAKLNSSE